MLADPHVCVVSHEEGRSRAIVGLDLNPVQTRVDQSGGGCPTAPPVGDLANDRPRAAKCAACWSTTRSTSSRCFRKRTVVRGRSIKRSARVRRWSSSMPSLNGKTKAVLYPARSRSRHRCGAVSTGAGNRIAGTDRGAGNPISDHSRSMCPWAWLVPSSKERVRDNGAAGRSVISSTDLKPRPLCPMDALRIPWASTLELAPSPQRP